MTERPPEPTWVRAQQASLRMPNWSMLQPSPVIGVSGFAGEDGMGSPSVKAAMAMVRAQGATPVFIGDHDKRDPAHDIQYLDGLVVLGNNKDIDPKTYGEAKDPKTDIETEMARANYERDIIELALQKKVPLLGICGGMQRLNVGGGEGVRGKLWQHVPDHLPDHSEYHMQVKQGVPPFVPVQAVHIDSKSSLLSRIAKEVQTLFVPRAGEEIPEGWLIENSMHHQCVDPNNIRKGFKLAASADLQTDGAGHIVSQIPEAIEPDPEGPYAGQFVLGVQWHPEFGASAISPRIFAELSTRARQYAIEQADLGVEKSAVALPPQGYPSQASWVERWERETKARVAQAWSGIGR